MLISMDGKVKVADFGIARAVSSQTMNAATVVGSVHYISPEQARGGYSDERSDLYSLGITMFEMVTGHVPFEGDNTVTVALAHLEEPMPDPRTLNPDVSPSLARIILKCTEKRPERRYPNAAAVISDLRRALLNDDDPTIGAVKEEDHSSDTIVISPKELNLIKTRSGERIRESKPVKEIRERRERRDLEKRYEQPEDAKKDQKKSKENDEATGLEKILTGLGVAAAVIIVAVVIVFILKLGGLFRSSTPEDPTEQVSQEATTEEAKTTAVSETTISQKEVYMPNLVGRSQDEAEKILQGLDLSMQVEQENSGVQSGHLGERSFEKAVGYGNRRVQNWRAERKLKPYFKDGKLPITAWRREREQLEQEYRDIQTELSPLHADAKKLWAIHYNIYEVQHEQERQNTTTRQKKQEIEH